MKRLIIFLLLFAAIKVAGQTTGYLRFDTVRIFKQFGTAELILINKTKDTTGLLTNIGGGYTQFLKPRALNDSTLVIGVDTITVKGTGGSGTVNLDSLRTAFNIKIVNGTDTTVFESATPTLAGAMPAADKVKVNRLEPYLNPVGLRANTNIDTGVIYLDSKGNGFRYDPLDVTTVDDTAMTIVTSGGARLKRVTPDGVVYAEWFGAIPDDGIRDDQQIQRAVDYVIANNTRFSTVKLRSGRYEIQGPIIMYRWDGTDYAFFTCKLVGEEAFWNSSGRGTRLVYNQKKNFVIGIQRGKGCEVSKIRIDGNFTPPSTSNHLNWYNTDFEDFVDPTVIDSVHAPYAGIVIDPFKQDAVLPLGGHYPGLEGYYRGTSQTGGTTGTIITDVQIRGFAVCIMNSANGTTLNSELTIIDRVQFAACRVGIAGGNDQEKANMVTNVAAWENIHTLFATGLYGAQTPGNWFIQGVNVAGNINRLVYLDHGNYFPTFIKDVFAESIGSVGTINGSMQTTFENCIFDFKYLEANNWSYPSEYNVNAVGSVVFKNSTFRYYGANVPITIFGNPKFENCRFDPVPFVENDPSSTSAQFINCKITGGYFGLRGEHEMQKTNLFTSTYYGDYIVNNSSSNNNFREKNYISGVSPRVNIMDVSAGLVSLTISATKTTKFTVTAAYKEYYRVGNLALYSDGTTGTHMLGKIDSVVVDTVYVGGVPKNIVTGNYYPGTSVPLFVIGVFGNMTSGSNKIGTYVVDIPAAGSLDGNVIYSEYFRGPNFEPYAMITSHTADTIVLNRNSLATQTGVFIGEYRKDYDRIDGGNQITVINRLLKEGGYVYTKDNSTERRVIKYLVTKSGYSVPTGGETRQGEWKADQPWTGSNYIRVTAATHTALPMEEYIDGHAGSNAINITLPTVANVLPGSAKSTKVLHVKKIDSTANTVTITAGAGSTIEGSSTYVLTDTGQAVTMHLDQLGNIWRIDNIASSSDSGPVDTTRTKNPIYVLTGAEDTLAFKYDTDYFDVTASDTSLTLKDQITAGSCTNCNITFNAKGQIIVAANGTPGSAGAGFGIDSTVIGGTPGAIPYVGTNSLLQESPTQLFYDSTNVRLGINTGTPSSKIHINVPGIGATPLDAHGIILSNSTAAAAGAQQEPPTVTFDGNGWKTNATAASQNVKVRLRLLPIQGAASPTWQFLMQSSIAGGAYSNPFNWTSDGSFTGSGQFTAGTHLALAGQIIWASSNRLVSPSNGVFTITNSAQNDINRVQWGGTSSAYPAWSRSTNKFVAMLADNSARTNVGVLDEAYNATTWDANDDVPTKNAVRDKIETISAATTIYTGDGTLAGNRIVDGNSNSLSLGQNSSRLSAAQINSAGLIQLFGLVQLNSENSTDADYTVTDRAGMVRLIEISSNRVVTLPPQGAGKFLIIWNQNSSGNTWTFSVATGGVVNAASGAITTLTNDTVYILVSDGTDYVRIN